MEPTRHTSAQVATHGDMGHFVPQHSCQGHPTRPRPECRQNDPIRFRERQPPSPIRSSRRQRVERGRIRCENDGDLCVGEDIERKTGEGGLRLELAGECLSCSSLMRLIDEDDRVGLQLMEAFESGGDFLPD